tara:strand:- start:1101 stop:2456 length:1356 start_codon:yes stop_codon:yes gene_type:complete
MAEFDYPAEDLLNPQGKNSLGSLGGFYQRSLYKDKIYPKTFPPPLETWHDKFLYGRVDPFQNTIVPSSINLIPIPSSAGTNVYALNVVVSAFEKFVLHMQKAAFARVVNITGNSALLDVKATRAFESAGNKYASYTQNLFNNFIRTIRGKERFQIQDFPSFVKVYSRYLLNVARITPLTRTNYYISSNTSLFSTGISIAIANEDASKDSNKYKDFVADPNFDFFRQCAKHFGFLINKNAPWILTADLFTTAFATTALGNYSTPDPLDPTRGVPLNKENFFSTFYDPTYLTDLDDLIRILVNSYEQFLIKEPFYDKEVGAVDERCSISAKPRKPLGVTAAQIINGGLGSAQLPDKLLIDLYIDLRQVEVQSPLSGVRLGKLKREVYKSYSSARVTTPRGRRMVAAGYVNATYTQYIYSKGAVVMQRLNRSLDISASDGTIPVGVPVISPDIY